MSTDQVMQKLLERIAHSGKNYFCIPKGVNFSSNRGTAQRGGGTNKSFKVDWARGQKNFLWHQAGEEQSETGAQRIREE